MKSYMRSGQQMQGVEQHKHKLRRAGVELQQHHAHGSGDSLGGWGATAAAQQVFRGIHLLAIRGFWLIYFKKS